MCNKQFWPILLIPRFLLGSYLCMLARAVIGYFDESAMDE